jgi:D-alanine-D-alanine ligase
MRIGITYDLKTDTPSAEEPVDRFPDDWQEEFDSPATIEAIADVLTDLGHEVLMLSDGRELLERLLVDPPDFIFNMAEGQGVSRSREARVPGVLEMLGIPYTGSDPLTLAVTLDKDCAKRLIQAAGIAVPKGVTVEDRGSIYNPRSSILDPQLSFPLIVKPAWEGSSKGIRHSCIVSDAGDLDSAIAEVHQDHRQPVLVEEFIDGDELTVGVFGNDPAEVLGIMRVLPRRPTQRFIYSLEVKRDFLQRVRYECPAQIPPTSLELVRQAALTVYRALGCRDVARVDFRLRDRVPYFLEANPLPGLNPKTSDLVIMAQLCGWSFEKLIATIFESAVSRTHRLTSGTGANVNRGITAGNV